MYKQTSICTTVTSDQLKSNRDCFKLNSDREAEDDPWNILAKKEDAQGGKNPGWAASRSRLN